MTSQEIIELISRKSQDWQDWKMDALWEIAYQLAKQVELGTETNQLLRIQISRMVKPDTLADPEPAKRYADSERCPCGCAYPDHFFKADTYGRENATLANVREVARSHGWDGLTFLSTWLNENLADPRPPKTDAEARRGKWDTEERWQQPNWTCPACRWSNFPIRSHCRNCNRPSPAAISFQGSQPADPATETEGLSEFNPSPGAYLAPEPSGGTPTESISARERLIRGGFCFDSDRDADAARYLIGVIDTLRFDRDRLREHFQREEHSEPAAKTADQAPPINPSETPHVFDGVFDLSYCFRCGGGRLHVIHTVKESYSLAGSGDTTKDASGERGNIHPAGCDCPTCRFKRHL